MRRAVPSNVIHIVRVSHLVCAVLVVIWVGNPAVAPAPVAAQTRERAEALRQAQLALLSNANLPDAANPAVWAPFVLIEN